MTKTDPKPEIAVTQADRDAAADWCAGQPFPSKQFEAPMIRQGEYDHHSLVQAFAAHRIASQHQPDDAAVERVARALYECERKRSEYTDAIISAAAGKTVNVGMEPWEECWQVFYDDARAAIAALT